MKKRTGTLRDFILAGNEVSFDCEDYPVDAHLVWYGTGNYIKISGNIKFNQTRITFIGNEGRLILGANCSLKGYLVIGDGCLINIGKRVFINRVSDIRALESCEVHIGKDCLFADVGIFTSDMHSVINLSNETRVNNPQSIKIENNVWLAESVRVSKGSLIGAGSIIGGRSIVNGKIPPCCLAVGSPARVVKEGVTWNQNRLSADSLKAVEFTGGDIPLNKEVIRYLINNKRFRLVYEAMNHHAGIIGSLEKLPVFALWYYILAKSKITSLGNDDKILLDLVLKKSPNHKMALALRGK